MNQDETTMKDERLKPCCGPDSSCGLDRRTILAIGGAAAAAALFPLSAAVAGPFEGEEFERLIPADKKFRPAWLASLTAKGTPETYSGDDLRYIGMPVGGIATGTLYLGGDGRLWLWDIFNRVTEGVGAKSTSYNGRPVGPRDGSLFVSPLDPLRPVDQGFALRLSMASGDRIVPLDRSGFRDVTFTGQYPVGTVEYRDPGVPVTARLEAFSPFVPLNADDSGLPATVLSFTLTNTSKAPVDLTLAGWLENAVCLHHREHAGVRRNHVVAGDGFTFLDCRVARPDVTAKPMRPDVVFEDWSKGRYEGWTVEGDAFGKGPIRKAEIPTYQGDVGGPGDWVANSHATAPGDDVGKKDGAVGKLTREFTVERNFLRLWVGGGGHAGKTCVNLVVGGTVERSVTGRNDNRMQLETLDVRAWHGHKATLEIVDAERGGWGNIGVGRITFSDAPPGGPLEALADFGTMGLALLGGPAEYKDAAVSTHGFGGKGAKTAEVGLEDKLVGAIGRTLTLEPGTSSTVTFVLTWHMPNLTVLGSLKGWYYASRFRDAAAVAAHVAGHADRLLSGTRTWRDTWYDSTLPYWFLNRTFATTSVLATTTCYRLKDGRFWAWEGVGCCPGTCTHVWHYAQAMARLFPELERDLRERVDFGLAFDRKSGVIRFRGEFGSTFAVDGQCGTILRAYREHQMSADAAFLKRIWPNTKAAMQAVIARDKDRSGVLFGPMHNTLDADWYGVVPWLVGLYHAALRAAEQMALDVGDEGFARECRRIFENGVQRLDRMTWKEDYGYYVHLGDEKHSDEVGSYDGCHIDQVFGQSWAWQVGLGRVMVEPHVRRALESLWRFAVAPDVGPFRAVNKPGRWYAMPGDGGLLMVTFPFGRPKAVSGAGAWSAMYFNECMSGFEWQAAGHMIWEGMATEGMAVARLVHDRYHARLRNPYNEIECSDHYARSMASYGAYLAACGFSYHGPKGHMAFAPRLRPDDFRAAFTAAEGWGTFAQTRKSGKLTATLTPKHGSVRLKTFGLELPAHATADTVTATVSGTKLAASVRQAGLAVTVTFERDVSVETGRSLELTVTYKI